MDIITLMSTAPTSPLHDLHQQAEAEFQNWGEVEIVQTFGQPQAEYAAIRKAAALIDLPQRGILELTGKDRLEFLNNLLTNQTWNKATKTGLSSGQGVYAFMLNLRGRIVVDMNVLELGDRTLLEMDGRFVEPLRRVLDQYLFGEQVKLVSRVGELHQIALHGPGAGQILGVALDSPLGSMPIKLLDIEAIVWRDDQAGVPGYHVILPSVSAALAWTSLIAKFGAEVQTGKRLLRPVGWAAFNATRIEAGRPFLGIDFDSAPIASALPGKKDESIPDAGTGLLPAETGLLDRAVSFTKGCYLGQEIVARMQARGQIARQIAGVRMEDDALPIAGSQAFDAQSSPIGVITSSTVSPMLSNAAICLALLKRPHFAIGTRLQIPAEGAMRWATVVELPFIKRTDPI